MSNSTYSGTRIQVRGFRYAGVKLTITFDEFMKLMAATNSMHAELTGETDKVHE